MHLSQFSKGISIQLRTDPGYGCIKNTKSTEIIVKISNNDLILERLIAVETFLMAGFMRKLNRKNIENEKGMPKQNISNSLKKFETNQKSKRLTIEKKKEMAV
ncbi:hypothetical protein MUP77_10035 [Candidatus Bathyarchaeota archaeon]|nr:hypothetical protein [Candidatus Bathyarchaeota archaeon]